MCHTERYVAAPYKFSLHFTYDESNILKYTKSNINKCFRILKLRLITYLLKRSIYDELYSLVPCIFYESVFDSSQIKMLQGRNPPNNRESRI